MSLDNLSPERVCYVHCNFCNTILAVSVPCNTTPTVVTVRCGHCANLLSVNMGALLIQSLPLHQDPQKLQKQKLIYEDGGSNCKEYSSSSSTTSGSSSSSISNNLFPHEFQSPTNHQQPRLPPIRPPEKRQRVPSAYNRFIKEEIQRIKASNPDISHREAFSTAAKNWAHFPHIHFGLKLDANKQVQLEQAVAGEGPQKSHHGFY